MEIPGTICLYVLIGVLLVAGCSNSKQSENTSNGRNNSLIYGRTWQWVSTVTSSEKTTITEPERYTVIFEKNGKAHMQFDCNRGQGDYTITENRITFGSLISTRMACQEGSLDWLFMKDLELAQSFFILDDNLFLELPHDSAVMRFEPTAGQPQNR